VLKRENIVLTTGFTAGINVTLQLGSLGETITVTSESPIVDTVNTRVQTVVNQALIEALPEFRTSACRNEESEGPPRQRAAAGLYAGRSPRFPGRNAKEDGAMLEFSGPAERHQTVAVKVGSVTVETAIADAIATIGENMTLRRASSLSVGEGVIAVPTRFLRNWVATHYADRLLALWRAENDRMRRLTIIVEPRVAAFAQAKEEEVSAPAPAAWQSQ